MLQIVITSSQRGATVSQFDLAEFRHGEAM